MAQPAPGGGGARGGHLSRAAPQADDTEDDPLTHDPRTQPRHAGTADPA